MTWIAGWDPDCGVQTNRVELMTVQLDAGWVPLAIWKLPVPGDAAFQL